MSNIAGTVNVQVSITDTLPVSATRLTAYPVPCKPVDATVNYLNGTAAGLASRFYQVSGSLVATTLDIDLTAIVCSDGTTGLTHFRELLIYNDDLTNVLTFGLGTNPITSLFMGGTTPTRIIQPGEVFRASKQYGTIGFLVDATHKILRLDSGANTIAYRVIILGD